MATKATVRRIQNATKIAMALKNAGFHPETVTTTTLIRICEVFIFPRAKYGVELQGAHKVFERF